MNLDALEVDSGDSRSSEEDQAALKSRLEQVRTARTLPKQPGWVPSYPKGYCCNCESPQRFTGGEKRCLNCEHKSVNCRICELWDDDEDARETSSADHRNTAPSASDPISVTYEKSLARRRTQSSARSLVEQVRLYFPAERTSLDTTHGIRGIDCLLELEQRRVRSSNQVSWSGEHYQWYEEEQSRLSDLHRITLKALHHHVFLAASNSLGEHDLADLFHAMFPEGSDMPGHLILERSPAEKRVRPGSIPGEQVSDGKSEMGHDVLSWDEVIEKLLELTDRTLKTIENAQSGSPPSLAYHPTAPVPPMPATMEQDSVKGVRKVRSLRSLFQNVDSRKSSKG